MYRIKQMQNKMNWSCLKMKKEELLKEAMILTAVTKEAGILKAIDLLPEDVIDDIAEIMEELSGEFSIEEQDNVFEQIVVEMSYEFLKKTGKR